MSVKHLCSQNVFQLMGMGVSVGVLMFLLNFWIIPIQEVQSDHYEELQLYKKEVELKMQTHDERPAHREANLVLDRFDDEFVKLSENVGDNTDAINRVGDSLIILNEKVSNLQQRP